MALEKLIATALACLALSGGVYFAKDWYRFNSAYQDAISTELASFDGAFGSAGTYRAPFHPKYAFICREMLCVEVDLPSETEEETRAVVADLKASMRIVIAPHDAVLDRQLTEEDFWPTWSATQGSQPIPAVQFSPVRPDEYEITLQVEEPASQLVGIPHRVVAKYALCGIERMQVLFTGGLAIVCFLVGGGLITWVGVSLRRTHE